VTERCFDSWLAALLEHRLTIAAANQRSASCFCRNSCPHAVGLTATGLSYAML